MLKDEVISAVLVKMDNVLNREQLAELKTAMVMVLYDKDIVTKSTELSIFEGDDINEKFLQRFAVEKKVENLAKGTIKNYLYETRKFFDYTGKRFVDVTKDDITVYLAGLTQKGYSLNTIDNTRKYIKAFFNWLAWNDYIVKNPFDCLKCTRREEVKKVVLTEKEIEEMRDACMTKKELAIFDFLNSTGVRVSEITNLTVDDVDFVTGKIHVYAIKTKTHRTAFLDAKALKHLIDYRSELTRRGIYSDALFLGGKRNKDGTYHAIGKNGVERILHQLEDRARIRKSVTVHVLRKTFASRLSKKGIKPEVIQYLLGHANFATTAKFYISIDDADIKHELERATA